jgi:outer membrane protein assembly factor BamA
MVQNIIRSIKTVFFAGIIGGGVASSLQAEQGRLNGFLIKPESIVFMGNHLVATADLRNVFRSAGTVAARLTPEQMDMYDSQRVNHGLETVLSFYKNRGFIKASIKPPVFDYGVNPSVRQIQMIITVVEDHPYHLSEIKISGAQGLTPAYLTALLNLTPKATINLAKIDSGIAAIREAYLNLGYLDVEITPILDPPDNKTAADLVLTIREGSQYHVGNVQFAGTTAIKENLLREFIPLQKGDIFGEKIFDVALQSLNAIGITPVLSTTDIDFTIDRNRAIVDLTINLQGKGKK